MSINVFVVTINALGFTQKFHWKLAAIGLPARSLASGVTVNVLVPTGNPAVGVKVAVRSARL